jgi:hypothetical protein
MCVVFHPFLYRFGDEIFYTPQTHDFPKFIISPILLNISYGYGDSVPKSSDERKVKKSLDFGPESLWKLYLLYNSKELPSMHSRNNMENDALSLLES